MSILLSDQEKLAALQAAVKEKVASMSDAEVAQYLAQADAEKVAEWIRDDAQAGGRVSFHGYHDSMARYEQLLDEHGNDKVAALNDLIQEVASLDHAYAELDSAKVAAEDVFSDADAEGLAKIAQDNSLPEETRRIAHNTLVRHGYELRDVAA